MNRARVTITFEFDPRTLNERELVDRLDALLVAEFDDVPEWHVRWVGANLGASPLFGAAENP